MSNFALFFNNHVVLVTEWNVVIFQLVYVPWLLCAECKKMVVSLGPYSCALFTKWRARADYDEMGVSFESTEKSSRLA
jgi:hypothetical protein